MYNQKVLDIFKNPMNFGGLHGANGVGKVVDELTNNISKIYMKIDENGVVEEARCKAVGNVITIVSASVATQLVVGKNVEDENLISTGDILSVLGDVEANKLTFVQLAVDAVREGVKEYKKSLNK